MRFDLNVIVDRPIDQVFEYASDPGRVPDWARPAQVRDKLTNGPIGVGTRYRAVDKMPGRKVEFLEEITVYEPNQRFALHMSDPFNGDIDTTFEPINGSTRIAMTVEMHPSGFFGVVAPILSSSLKRMLQRDLDNLKVELEATHQL